MTRYRRNQTSGLTPLSAALLVLSFAVLVGGILYGTLSSMTAADTLAASRRNGTPIDYNARMLRMYLILGITFVASTALLVASIVVIVRHNRARRDSIVRLAETREEMHAREFLDAAGCVGAKDYTGVYILHNKSKNLHYVGQSVHVLQRVSAHLTGHGNGDIYADFKYGDSFTVRLVPLVGSGYQSLNDLERDMIEAYDAYAHGYNATRGNKT